MVKLETFVIDFVGHWPEVCLGRVKGVVKPGTGIQIGFHRYWRLMCFAAIIRTTRVPVFSLSTGPSKWIEA